MDTYDDVDARERDDRLDRPLPVSNGRGPLDDDDREDDRLGGGGDGGGGRGRGGGAAAAGDVDDLDDRDPRAGGRRGGFVDRYRDRDYRASDGGREPPGGYRGGGRGGGRQGDRGRGDGGGFGRDRRDRRDETRSLHCRGYDVATTDEDKLRTVFATFGKVADVYLPKEYYTGKYRGFAYIQFEDERDAERAREELDRSDILKDGRICAVMWASGRRKTPIDMRRIDIERDNPHVRDRDPRAVMSDVANAYGSSGRRPYSPRERGGGGPPPRDLQRRDNRYRDDYHRRRSYSPDPRAPAGPPARGYRSSRHDDDDDESPPPRGGPRARARDYDDYDYGPGRDSAPRRDGDPRRDRDYYDRRRVGGDPLDLDDRRGHGPRSGHRRSLSPLSAPSGRPSKRLSRDLDRENSRSPPRARRRYEDLDDEGPLSSRAPFSAAPLSPPARRTDPRDDRMDPHRGGDIPPNMPAFRSAPAPKLRSVAPTSPTNTTPTSPH